MKILLTIMLLLYFVCPAFAAGKTKDCVLSNKEFCGHWNGIDGDLDVTGLSVIWADGQVRASCGIVKESRSADGRPYTLLKCMSTVDPRYSDEGPEPVDYLMAIPPKSRWEHDVHLYRMKLQETLGYKMPLTGICWSNDSEDFAACDLEELSTTEEFSGFSWFSSRR